MESTYVRPEVACESVDINLLENLPEDWEENFFEQEGLFYYQNKKTKESKWTWPGFEEKFKQRESEHRVKLSRKKFRKPVDSSVSNKSFRRSN